MKNQPELTLRIPEDLLRKLLYNLALLLSELVGDGNIDDDNYI